MSRWVLAAVVGMAAVVLAGLGLSWVGRQRVAAELTGCRNNLRVVATFAAFQADPAGGPPLRPVNEIPAGTLFNPALPPGGRLSWFVAVLPGLDQRRQKTDDLIAGIDRTAGWATEKNQAAARTPVRALLCPGRPPQIDPAGPAPTSYCGVAGLGPDAATLALGPGPVPPRAGCFRYDAPTPFDRIADGLSQTILMGEKSPPFGPWLQGGPSTVRGVETGPAAPARVGDGGQFGGSHPAGANFAFADGSVRTLTPRVDAGVFDGMATIAGGEAGVERESE